MGARAQGVVHNEGCSGDLESRPFSVFGFRFWVLVLGLRFSVLGSGLIFSESGLPRRMRAPF